MINKMVQYNRNNEARGVCSVVGTIESSDLTLAGSTATEIVAVPAGALITKLYVNVITAFDSTTATVDVGTEADEDAFSNDLDLKTAGIVAGTGVDIKVDVITRIRLTQTVTGTATVGKVQVIVEYIDTECVTGTYIESGN